MSSPRSNRPLDPLAHVDRLLRSQSQSRSALEPSTGRVRERVEARLDSYAPPAEESVHFSWFGALAFAAVVTVAVSAWWTVLRPASAPVVAGSSAVARFAAAVEQSSAAIRGAQPEQPIVAEARRLKSELQRGVGFVLAVMPRFRLNG